MEGYAYFHKFVTNSNSFQMVVLYWHVEPLKSYYVKLYDAGIYIYKPHYNFVKLVVKVRNETWNYSENFLPGSP